MLVLVLEEKDGVTYALSANEVPDAEIVSIKGAKRGLEDSSLKEKIAFLQRYAPIGYAKGFRKIKKDDYRVLSTHKMN